MVKTSNLSYQYPQGVSITFPDFAVKAGETLLILGESGCGKTTLLHVLAGLLRPTTGEVMVDDVNVSKLDTAALDQFRGQHIGVVYQQPYFIAALSVLDNLLLSPFAADKGRARTIAKRLHIEEVLRRHPHQLSVGQQQRATIARAVMNTPKLLLADEPTSALDNSNCAQVVDLLREEAQANNAALIIVTHDDRLKREISACIELPALSLAS